MTPPPDAAVAALAGATADALCYDGPDCEHMDEHLQKAKYVIAALHAAGWTLSRRSDHEAATAAEARVAVLEGIVKWAASMGLCSQTHHEHLMREARAALVAGEGEGDG